MSIDSKNADFRSFGGNSLLSTFDQLEDSLRQKELNKEHEEQIAAENAAKQAAIAVMSAGASLLPIGPIAKLIKPIVAIPAVALMKNLQEDPTPDFEKSEFWNAFLGIQKQIESSNGPTPPEPLLTLNRHERMLALYARYCRASQNGHSRIAQESVWQICEILKDSKNPQTDSYPEDYLLLGTEIQQKVTEQLSPEDRRAILVAIQAASEKFSSVPKTKTDLMRADLIARYDLLKDSSEEALATANAANSVSSQELAELLIGEAEDLLKNSPYQAALLLAEADRSFASIQNPDDFVSKARLACRSKIDSCFNKMANQNARFRGISIWLQLSKSFKDQDPLRAKSCFEKAKAAIEVLPEYQKHQARLELAVYAATHLKSEEIEATFSDWFTLATQNGFSAETLQASFALITEIAEKSSDAAISALNTFKTLSLKRASSAFKSVLFQSMLSLAWMVNQKEQQRSKQTISNASFESGAQWKVVGSETALYLSELRREASGFVKTLKDPIQKIEIEFAIAGSSLDVATSEIEIKKLLGQCFGDVQKPGFLSAFSQKDQLQISQKIVEGLKAFKIRVEAEEEKIPVFILDAASRVSDQFRDLYEKLLGEDTLDLPSRSDSLKKRREILVSWIEAKRSLGHTADLKDSFGPLAYLCRDLASEKNEQAKAYLDVVKTLSVNGDLESAADVLSDFPQALLNNKKHSDEIKALFVSGINIWEGLNKRAKMDLSSLNASQRMTDVLNQMAAKNEDPKIATIAKLCQAISIDKSDVARSDKILREIQSELSQNDNPIFQKSCEELVKRMLKQHADQRVEPALFAIECCLNSKLQDQGENILLAREQAPIRQALKHFKIFYGNHADDFSKDFSSAFQSFQAEAPESAGLLFGFIQTNDLHAQTFRLDLQNPQAVRKAVLELEIRFNRDVKRGDAAFMQGFQRLAGSFSYHADENTQAYLRDLLKRMGKQEIVVREAPGFAFNLATIALSFLSGGLTKLVQETAKQALERLLLKWAGESSLKLLQVVNGFSKAGGAAEEAYALWRMGAMGTKAMLEATGMSYTSFLAGRALFALPKIVTELLDTALDTFVDRAKNLENSFENNLTEKGVLKTIGRIVGCFFPGGSAIGRMFGTALSGGFSAQFSYFIRNELNASFKDLGLNFTAPGETEGNILSFFNGVAHGIGRSLMDPDDAVVRRAIKKALSSTPEFVRGRFEGILWEMRNKIVSNLPIPGINMGGLGIGRPAVRFPRRSDPDNRRVSYGPGTGFSPKAPCEAAGPAAGGGSQRPVLLQGELAPVPIGQLSQIDGIVVGRNGVVKIEGSNISKNHSAIRLTRDPATGNPILEVRDLGSKNGTFISDESDQLQATKISNRREPSGWLRAKKWISFGDKAWYRLVIDQGHLRFIPASQIRNIQVMDPFDPNQPTKRPPEEINVLKVNFDPLKELDQAESEIRSFAKQAGISVDHNQPDFLWFNWRQDGSAFAARSNKGFSGYDTNEDRSRIVKTGKNSRWDYAIDGMGGHRGAEQAARIADVTLIWAAKQGLDPKAALLLVNKMIVQICSKNSQGNKMPGVVLALTEVTYQNDGSTRLKTFSVGDSARVVVAIGPDGRCENGQAEYWTNRPNERQASNYPEALTKDGRLNLEDQVAVAKTYADENAKYVNTSLGNKGTIQESDIHVDEMILAPGKRYVVFNETDGASKAIPYPQRKKLIDQVISANHGLLDPAQIADAVETELLVRQKITQMADDLGKDIELTREVYVQAYQKCFGKEPPQDWKYIYADQNPPFVLRKIGLLGKHFIYKDRDLFDSFERDNVSFTVSVYGGQNPGGIRSQAGSSSETGRNTASQDMRAYPCQIKINEPNFGRDNPARKFIESAIKRSKQQFDFSSIQSGDFRVQLGNQQFSVGGFSTLSNVIELGPDAFSHIFEVAGNAETNLWRERPAHLACVNGTWFFSHYRRNKITQEIEEFSCALKTGEKTVIPAVTGSKRDFLQISIEGSAPGKVVLKPVTFGS